MVKRTRKEQLAKVRGYLKLALIRNRFRILFTIVIIIIVSILSIDTIRTAVSEARNFWDVLMAVVLAVGGGFIAALLNNPAIDERLARLHQSVIEGFPEKVWTYHPKASKEVSRFFCDQNKVFFQSYGGSILIIKAKDTYRIRRDIDRFVSTNGVQTPLWHLDFKIYWKWKNDSSIARLPLSDLAIIVAAPIEAVEGGGRGRTGESTVEEYKKETGRFSNRLMSIIPNPREYGELLSEEEQGRLEELFKVNKLSCRVGSGPWKPLELEDRTLEVTPHAGIYQLKTIPWSAAKKITLREGDEMEVLYEGETTATVDQEEGVWGAVRYPPSDVVQGGENGGYDLEVIYPETIVYSGSEKRIEIDDKRSHCRHVHHPADRRVHDRAPRTIPTEFADSCVAQHMALVRVDRSVSPLDLVSIVWQVR